MKTDYIKQGNSADLLKTLPTESVDMVMTSPPYDNLRDYKSYDFPFETIANELGRVIKPGGVIVWVIADQTVNGSESGSSFKQALYFKQIGLNLHDTMIWAKDSCAFPETTRYYQTFEYMFVFSKGRPKTINLIDDRENKWGGCNVYGTFRKPNGETVDRSTTWKSTMCKDYGVRFNVWNIPAAKGNKTGHPAVFPKQLVADHIISWSAKGDLVLDPFVGSGTTALVAFEMGRHYIGFDIAKEYVDIANERMKNAVQQQTLF